MGIFDIRHLLDPDKKIGSQKLYNQRILACNYCELLTRFRRCGNGVTTGCGCFIDEKAKLKTEWGGVCPRNKWGKSKK